MYLLGSSPHAALRMASGPQTPMSRFMARRSSSSGRAGRQALASVPAGDQLAAKYWSRRWEPSLADHTNRRAAAGAPSDARRERASIHPGPHGEGFDQPPFGLRPDAVRAPAAPTRRRGGARSAWPRAPARARSTLRRANGAARAECGEARARASSSGRTLRRCGPGASSTARAELADRRLDRPFAVDRAQAPLGLLQEQRRGEPGSPRASRIMPSSCGMLAVCRLSGSVAASALLSSSARAAMSSSPARIITSEKLLYSLSRLGWCAP